MLMDIKNFSPTEQKFFSQEMNKQFAECKGFDVYKAAVTAKFLAIMERCDKQRATEHFVSFTDEQWKEFITVQEVYLAYE